MGTQWAGDTSTFSTHLHGDTSGWGHSGVRPQRHFPHISWGHIGMGTQWAGNASTFSAHQLGTHRDGDTMDWERIDILYTSAGVTHRDGRP